MAITSSVLSAAGRNSNIAGYALSPLHGDHLGSATLTTDINGNRVGDLRYTPHGVTRYEWGSIPTNRRYTGQRWDSVLGLYDYQARYYHPALGRLISADPLMPEPGNPQALNRYAYVTNNPVRYNDPSGYIRQDEAERALQIIRRLHHSYNIIIPVDFGWVPGPSGPGEPEQIRVEGVWELSELETIERAVRDMSAAMGGVETFRQQVGKVYIRRMHYADIPRLFCEYIYPRVAPAALTTWRVVTLYDETFAGPHPEATIVHEIAHVWDWSTWASESLEDFVGDAPRPTAYAQTNAEEHWAETVTSWVYSDYPEFELSLRHRQYLALAVNGQIPIPWWVEPPNQGLAWP